MKEFFSNEVVQLALWALAYVIVFFVCKAFSKKLENNKLKDLINLLPEAMEYAEKNGASADEKLNIAIDYIQSELKLSRKTIVNFIENGITISKNINKEDSTMQSKVSEQPITIVQKNLDMTLNEEEAMLLANVIAASGRTNDVAQIYNCLVQFTEATK